MWINAQDLQRQRSAIAAILRQAGIIPTQQRLDIALVMLTKPQHLSADQVLELVNRARKSVSKATVYNTLSLFSRTGVVREVRLDPNRVFYDSNTADHYHLYNEDTGILTDVATGCVRREALPPLPEGTALTGIDVIIRIRNV